MKEKLGQAFLNLTDSIIAAVPKITMAVVFVIAALVIARVVEKALRYTLAKVRFDALVGKTGVDQALQRLGIRQQLTELIPRLIYFLILLILAKTGVDASMPD